jgi:uncharacterized protein (UPF0262 family)
MPGRSIHVTSNANLWQIKVAGSTQAIKTVPTQAEAIQIGRSLAIESGSELVVYRSDGTIRSKDNYAHSVLANGK